MSQTKERPILFSAPMVRAILEGRKTVTRRPVKATKTHADGFMMLDHGKGWWPYNAFGDFSSDSEAMEYPIACPYGQPGDRLWVRETFAVYGDQDMHVIHYRADRPWDEGRKDTGYKPSIHMPRWACRILLEITAVRVERLQDISEEQAMAEGIHKQLTTGWYSVPGTDGAGTTPRNGLANLWKSTGGDWDANPWVWVVEFKRVTP